MDVRQLLDLKGRAALVTGGYGIYGAPISEALAEAGAHVVIASRSLEACAAMALTLGERGLLASAETYDQASEGSILGLRDRLISRFGAIPVLINNSVGRSMRNLATAWTRGAAPWRSMPPVSSPSRVRSWSR